MVGGVLSVSRAPAWWLSKIPPLLGTGYAVLLARHAGRAGVRTLLLGIAALCCVAVYAYLVNDLTDVAEDERRGKPNALATVSRRAAIALCAGLAGTAAALAWLAGASVLLLVLLVAECLLPLLYSVRPMRLKERGIWGVIADATLVHALPTLWIGLLSAQHGSGSWRSALVLGMATFGAASLGVRGIVLHQLKVHRDGRVSLRTFGAMVSEERLATLLLRRLLPIEWSTLSVLAVALFPVAPILLPAAGVILMVELVRRKAGWRIPDFRDARGRETAYVPLVFNDVQEGWLPVVLVVQLAVHDPVLWMLVVGHALAFLPLLRETVRGAVALPGQLRAHAKGQQELR